MSHAQKECNCGKMSKPIFLDCIRADLLSIDLLLCEISSHYAACDDAVRERERENELGILVVPTYTREERACVYMREEDSRENRKFCMFGILDPNPLKNEKGEQKADQDKNLF